MVRVTQEEGSNENAQCDEVVQHKQPRAQQRSCIPQRHGLALLVNRTPQLML